MARLRTRTRHLLLSLGKGIVSVAVIGFIALHIDRSMLAANWHKLSLPTIGALLGILAVQTAGIVAVRLKFVLTGLGISRSLAAIWRVAISGSFVEQIALGFVGGDATRLWLLHRLDLPMKTAAAAILLDRFLGFCAQSLLAAAGLSGLVVMLPIADQQIMILIAGAGLLMAAVAVVVVARRASVRRHLSELAAQGANAVRDRRFRLCLLTVFALALLTQILNVFVFFLVGRDLNIQIGLFDWFLIAPPALLLAMLPVTAGGWGLREASLIVALAPLGVPPETAIVPSIIFGLGALLVTLPGGVVLLFNQRAPRPAQPVTNGEENVVARFCPDHLAVSPLTGSPRLLCERPSDQ